MAEIVDCPKSLRSEIEREHRRGLLQDPHVGPLTDYVLQIRRDTGLGDEVAFFDPLDGGTAACCLYLLEAPGARAVASGFISRNNPDESATNFFELNRDAGIPRKATVTWNIVPWYIGSGKKIRSAKKTDIAEGLCHLQQLLHLLPALRVVIIMGQKPALAEDYIRAARSDVEIVRSPHPSPLYVNNRPANRDNILRVLKAVAENLLDTRPPEKAW
jgi:uracil-DNA glycosylase